jgi:hypothetical protein
VLIFKLHTKILCKYIPDAHRHAGVNATHKDYHNEKWNKRQRPLAFDKSGRAHYHARQIASSANLSLFFLRKSALCVRISPGTRVAPPTIRSYPKSDSLPVAALPPMSKSHYLQTLALFVGKIFIQPQIVRALPMHHSLGH